MHPAKITRSDMVTMPDGALMPAVLAARGEAGWGFDEDRDSELAAKLAEHVKALDALAVEWRRSADVDPVTWGDTVTATWVEIRKITQGRDITEGQS